MFRGLHVLQLGERRPPAGTAMAWPADLRPLWWTQDLGPLKPVAEVLAATEPAGSNDAAAVDVGTYRASWQPQVAGRQALRVSEPALDDLELVQSVEVVRPDAELRHTPPDRQCLADLAAAASRPTRPGPGGLAQGRDAAPRTAGFAKPASRSTPGAPRPGTRRRAARERSRSGSRQRRRSPPPRRGPSDDPARTYNVILKNAL